VGLTPSQEMYLKTIYLLRETNKVARVKDIANRMNVTMSSVNGAIKTLVSLGLCSHDKYGYVDLTTEGENVAATVVSRHTVLARFLSEVLGVEPEIAKEDACEMEHIVSDTTLDRFVSFLSFVDGCGKGAADMIKHYHEFLEFGECQEECSDCVLTSAAAKKINQTTRKIA
jgi:DtxR family Mn-dependent transcriptional regulator